MQIFGAGKERISLIWKKTVVAQNMTIMQEKQYFKATFIACFTLPNFLPCSFGSE
jgi:hypothetical protein